MDYVYMKEVSLFDFEIVSIFEGVISLADKIEAGTVKRFDVSKSLYSVKIFNKDKHQKYYDEIESYGTSYYLSRFKKYNNVFSAYKNKSFKEFLLSFKKMIEGLDLGMDLNENKSFFD